MNNSRRSPHGFLRFAAFIFSVPALAAETDGGTGGTWITTAAYPLFASEHGATVVENKIYVAGGFAGPNQNFSGTTNRNDFIGTFGTPKSCISRRLALHSR